MRRLRYFTVGPLIVAMAFSLPSTTLMVAQIVSGVFYTCLGFLYCEK